mmetsp:Transcript_78491/g.244489  ORF Transcript_78491/g.244489 Transcript_78491/m.244489 type:complete len:284 (+) Transcript_78491:86-937(+)
MRESLIKQAVNFLSNPGLASTPTEKKRDFLKGKGLTDEEIDEATRRAEEKDAAPAAAVVGPAAEAPAAAAAPQPVARVAGGSAQALPLPPPRAGMVGAGLQPTSRGVSMQAVLLLQRRLAELEHERACYIEALESLGMKQPDSAAALPAPPPAAPAVRAAPPSPPPAPAPAAAPPAATVPAAGDRPAARTETGPSTLAAGGSAASARVTSAPSAQPGPAMGEGPANGPASAGGTEGPAVSARKPWETASGPGSPHAKAAAGPPGGLREDDPDIVDAFPLKSKV